jgi:hypothetical protein
LAGTGGSLSAHRRQNRSAGAAGSPEDEEEHNPSAGAPVRRQILPAEDFAGETADFVAGIEGFAAAAETGDSAAGIGDYQHQEILFA